MVTTFDQALARCLAERPYWREPECRAYVEAGMVGGAFCDGAIVSERAPSGAIVRRCIPSATAAAVEAARRAAPLPTPVGPLQAAPPAGVPPVILAAAMVAAGALVVMFLARALRA